MSTLLATAAVAKVWRRSWNVGQRPWVPPDVLPLVGHLSRLRLDARGEVPERDRQGPERRAVGVAVIPEGQQRVSWQSWTIRGRRRADLTRVKSGRILRLSLRDGTLAGPSGP